MNRSMIKKVVALLCFICISLTTLSGCGSFFAEEELIISSVEHKRLEDGSIQITITYADEMKDPDVFVIPKGETGDVGEVGNGIASIIPTYDDEARKTILTVNYTDETQETFEVPYGVSIEAIEGFKEDEITGQLYIQLLYTNGELSEPIYMDKPKDGKDGVGIVNITSRPEDDGSQTLIIELTDGTKLENVRVPAPERGVGIADIKTDYNEARTQYYIEVTYTDPTIEPDTFWFDRPNTWFSGQGTPDSGMGIAGDLYFDTLYSRIYVKEAGGWVLKTKFVQDLDSCEVTFYNNYQDDGQEGKQSYSISKGHYFEGSGYAVPEPTRTGYKFIGWYTTRNPNLTTQGSFNSFTAVYSNMNLYAIWEPIA